MYIPVWHFMSGSNAYELSTHHTGWLQGSIVSVHFIMSLINCITLFNNCIHWCLGSLLLYLEMLLPFLCPLSCFCLRIEILLLSDEYSAVALCLVYCFLHLCCRRMFSLSLANLVAILPIPFWCSTWQVWPFLSVCSPFYSE